MHDPQYYTSQWKMMNEEMAEDNTPVVIKIPTIEIVEQWLKRDALPNQTTNESRTMLNSQQSQEDT